MILTHWILTKKAVKRIREVYLYEKFHELKISDDGTTVMVSTYNSFACYDTELNLKGEAKGLVAKHKDGWDINGFYDLRPMPGGHFIANLEHGSSSVFLFDYSG